MQHNNYSKITNFLLFLLLTATGKALYEGDDCVVQNTRQNGKCISINDCEYAKSLLQKLQRPEHCGFNAQFPLVCCPATSTSKTPPPTTEKPPPITPRPPPGQRSIDKCKQYHDVNKKAFAAAGGTKALPKEFKHMAAVGYGKNQRRILWLCGGTLISSQYVLTAAHCTYSQEFGAAKWVRLGDLDLKNTTEDARPEDFAIIEVFKHPEYKSPRHYNDIALLKLEREAELNPFVEPACLHTTNQLPSNKLQATGWGKTAFLGDPSSHLIKVDLDVIDPEACRKAYPAKTSSRRLPNGILEQSQICAGDVLGRGRDTCPGDSGGPLHLLKPKDNIYSKHFILVGITSFGKACGYEKTVGIYTRVSAYIEWIEDIVWPVNN